MSGSSPGDDTFFLIPRDGVERTTTEFVSASQRVSCNMLTSFPLNRLLVERAKIMFSQRRAHPETGHV